ncbi:MAG TPA: zf-HC2 domain-containing protein [bacterium]|nr:zf-HC2 domain-containing protein [bacterium]
MCPDRQIISAYFDGEVESPWDRAIADHIAGCEKCRRIYDGLEETRRLLQGERLEGVTAPMERVRRNLLAGVPPVTLAQPGWKRHVEVPLPMAVAAALLIVALGVGFAVALSRSGMGYIRVTRAPAGNTEYQFAIPYDKMESLLKSVGGAAASSDELMTLPKDVKLVPVGTPTMGREAEYPRKRS